MAARRAKLAVPRSPTGGTLQYYILPYMERRCHLQPRTRRLFGGPGGGEGFCQLRATRRRRATTSSTWRLGQPRATSYAANWYVFGNNDGGSANIPKTFQDGTVQHYRFRGALRRLRQRRPRLEQRQLRRRAGTKPLEQHRQHGLTGFWDNNVNGWGSPFNYGSATVLSTLPQFQPAPVPAIRRGRKDLRRRHDGRHGRRQRSTAQSRRQSADVERGRSPTTASRWVRIGKEK